MRPGPGGRRGDGTRGLGLPGSRPCSARRGRVEGGLRDTESNGLPGMEKDSVPIRRPHVRWTVHGLTRTFARPQHPAAGESLLGPGRAPPMRLGPRAQRGEDHGEGISPWGSGRLWDSPPAPPSEVPDTTRYGRSPTSVATGSVTVSD